MAFRKFNRVGLPGEHSYARGTDGESLLEGGGGGRVVQTRTARNCSMGWASVVIAAIAIAVTALIVGSIALRNTNEGLIGKVANLVVGNFTAMNSANIAENFTVGGNGNIVGSLVVGGGITSRKRAEGEMAVDVNGPSRFVGDLLAQTTLQVGETLGRKRGADGKLEARGNSRGRTRSQCRSEKLKVLGSASFCGGIQVNGTANLTDTNVNGTLKLLGSSTVSGNLTVAGNVFADNVYATKYITTVNETATNIEATTLTSLSATITSLTTSSAVVTGQLTLANRTRRTLYVGASREYKNISHALQQFTSFHAGDVHIYVDPGTYVDNVEIGGNFSSSLGLERGVSNEILSTGLSIFGDPRDHVGITYIDGAPLAYPPPLIDYEVRLSTGQVFEAVGSAYDSDGQVSGVGVVTVNDGVADNTNGCETPFANAGAVAGKAVLIQRGLCGFQAKSQNAAVNGAAVTILYQNSPAAPVVAGGGPANTLPGLSVMISLADATLIQSLLLTNPSLTVSVVPKPPITFGASNGVVDIVHPGGNLSVLQINVSGTNPNFASTSLLVVPGDQITVSRPSNTTTVFLYTVRRTIASVSGNMLTLTEPLPADFGVLYSSVTFLPNVILMSQNPKRAILSAINAGFYIEGVTLVVNPAFALSEQTGGFVLRDSFSVYARMVLDYSQRGGGGPLSIVRSALFAIPYAPKSFSFLTVLFGGALVTEKSVFSPQYMYVINSPQSALNVDANSYTRLISLQTSGGNYLDVATNTEVQAVRASSIVGNTIWIAGFGANAPIISAAVQSRIACGSTTLVGPKTATNVAVNSISSSDIGLDNLVIDGVANGIVALAGAKVLISTTLTLTNITFNRYVIHDKSTFTAYYTTAIPLDVITHTTAAPVIDHAFETQVLNGAGSALAATMDAGQLFATRALYLGKRYSILNLDGAAHTIKLAAGQRFEVPGMPVNSNTFTFAAVNNTQVQLFVRSSTRVVVEQNTAGGTFSLTSPTKRDLAPRSHDSVHAEEMYLEYLHSIELSTSSGSLSDAVIA